MSIATLYNVPGTQQELAWWSFAHAVHHLDIINTVYFRSNIALAQYILDPFDPSDENNMNNWAYQHQVMHQQMDALLGIAGFDLSSVDWKEPGERAAWIQLNAAEHYQASTILGIG